MWNRLADSPLIYPFLTAAVLLSVAVSFAIENQVALPVLETAFAYPLMISLLARQKRVRAIGSMLYWALMLGLTTVVTSVLFPDRAAITIFHGKEYVAEMFHWIRTGVGAEGTPRIFIPQHLLHLGIFVILSLFTAGALSLLMGAALMNYMSFYVASLIHASTNTTLACWLGWHPWSILRIISFVMLGVLLSEPLLCRIVGSKYNFAPVRNIFWIAIAGLVADIGMKTMLAPWWGSTLRNILP